MEMSPPAICPWCLTPSVVVEVVERDGTIQAVCFACDFPIRMAR